MYSYFKKIIFQTLVKLDTPILLIYSKIYLRMPNRTNILFQSIFWRRVRTNRVRMNRIRMNQVRVKLVLMTLILMKAMKSQFQIFHPMKGEYHFLDEALTRFLARIIIIKYNNYKPLVKVFTLNCCTENCLLVNFWRPISTPLFMTFFGTSSMWGTFLNCLDYDRRLYRVLLKQFGQVPDFHLKKPYPAQDPCFNLDSNKWFPGADKASVLSERDTFDEGRVTYFC